MKVLSTDGLTKLIQLIKNGFISVDDTVTTSTTTLATVATSGSYNDLSDKPTIPAAQVNSDWNATSGKAQILNKPTIPTVPTIATSVSASSTNAETVGAKLFYDTCGNIESLINAL